jgi:cation diffusion facilitator family transporter
VADSGQRALLRAGLASLVVGAGLLALKYVAYLWTGSAAILSDALETVVNVVAAIFALGSLVFAGRPADRDHPYGHGKIEYFSAVFEGGSIAIAAFLIVGYAIRDLLSGPQVAEIELGLLLTVLAGAVNAALGWYLLRTGQRANSLILVADGRHVLTDFWTSVGVVVGLVLVRVTGQAWLDPAVALVLGVNLAVTGLRLVRTAAGGLLDEEDTPLIVRLVGSFERTREPGIIALHCLRAIRSGRVAHVDANVIVPEFWSVERAHEVSDAFAARVLADCAIEGEIVFHADPCRRALCGACEVADCPVRRERFSGRAPLTVEEATRVVDTHPPAGR